MCVVSIQYVTHPLLVFREVRPGCCGRERPSWCPSPTVCFPTKAVAVWLGTTDQQHVELVRAYFERAAGWFGRDRGRPVAGLTNGDPLYAVWGAGVGYTFAERTLTTLSASTGTGWNRTTPDANFYEYFGLPVAPSCLWRLDYFTVMAVREEPRPPPFDLRLGPPAGGVGATSRAGRPALAVGHRPALRSLPEPDVNDDPYPGLDVDDPWQAGRGLLRPGLDGWPAGGAAHRGARGADARGRGLGGPTPCCSTNRCGTVRSTAWHAAINAVMAGLPAGSTSLSWGAALAAIGDPEFTLHGPATSTGGAALMVIVNGPVREAIGLHGGGKPLRPGGPRQRHHRPGRSDSCC